ncbi:hypothetical protein ZWY2020_026874 [Hordeum vulgare]|nr:hypothetical protein ZWY2020_026874 [Hordeum vulgare]
MENIQQALKNAGLERSVKTNHSDILANTGAPLLATVYPYFAYASDLQNIKLNFATFMGRDNLNDSRLTYTNLFDQMVDSIDAAL